MAEFQPTSCPLAVGLGEVLWDLLPAGKQLGGAPANFAYHARVLGCTSAVVSAVGRDGLGEEILSRLRTLGLESSHLARDPMHPTGTVSVKLDLAGIPSYVIHTNVAWDFIPDSPGLHALAERTDLVCFGSLAQRAPVSRQTIQTFIQATRSEALRVFDINLRQNYFSAAILRSSFEHANVLKVNDQELPIVADLLDLPRVEGETVKAMLGQFPFDVIAVTRGGSGSSLYTADAAAHHDGFAVTIVDTVGAGDAFTAALATGLLERKPLAEINEFANRLASFVCTQHGATPAVPDHLTRWC